MLNDLLEPWRLVDERRRAAIEAELARELPPDHVLAGWSVRAMAARIDNDDVLVEVVGTGYAVVHLTWSGRRESDPRWPSTKVFASIEEWRERRMLPDHQDYVLE